MQDERADDVPIQQETAEPAAGEPGQAATECADLPSPGPSPASTGVHPLIHMIIDLGVGFCLLIVVGTFALAFHRVAPNLALPFAIVVFFVVAMARSIWSKLNPWTEGIAISLGAFFPIALVGLAFQGTVLTVFAYGFMLALICGSGAQTQRFVRRRQWAGSAATVAALVVVLIAAKYVIPRTGSSLGRRTMNEPAPRFTVTMLDGRPVTLDSLKGRVVVMDFWGTWCGPCLAEMPAIQKVHRNFASNSNVVFLAVNAGWHGDDADTVRSFVERRHLDLPVALDPDGAVRQMKVDALPTLVLIDRQGRIRMEEAGYDASEPLESDLTGKIQRLLQQ